MNQEIGYFLNNVPHPDVRRSMSNKGFTDLELAYYMCKNAPISNPTLLDNDLVRFNLR